MPQVSAELRWFIREDAVDENAAMDLWFRSGCFPPGGGKERSDVYLLDPATDELGIKARGGKPGIEVKALVDPSRAVLELGTRASRVQVWSKVTSSVLDLPEDAAKHCATSKLRWLRKFAGTIEIELGGGKNGEEPKTVPAPDVGCNVEWTTVTVKGRRTRWRTLGLESFAFVQEDGDATLVPSLRHAIESLGPLPALSKEWKEMSYPAWMRVVAASP